MLLIAPSRAAASSVFYHAACNLPFLAPDYLLADVIAKYNLQEANIYCFDKEIKRKDSLKWTT